MNRSGLLECPRSQATTVSMSLWSKISESMCEQIGVIEVPRISRAGLESKRQLDEAELALEATRTPATPLRQTSDNA